MLPKEKVKAERKSPKNMIIYSPPKTGKTTLLSMLDDCLIIDCEDGTKYVDALKIKCIGLTAPAEKEEEKKLREERSEYYLNEIGREISKAGRPYKYVALDTITKLEEWCEEQGTKDYMNSPMGSSFNRVGGEKGAPIDYKNYRSVLTLPNGNGYLWLRTAFNEWIDKINKLADHVILVGHLKEKITEKDGKEVNAKDLDLTGKLKSISCTKADAIGYMYRRDNKVFINFKSSDEVVGGSRCNHLRGTEIDLAESNENHEIIRCDWHKIFVD